VVLVLEAMGCGLVMHGILHSANGWSGAWGNILLICRVGRVLQIRVRSVISFVTVAMRLLCCARILLTLSENSWWHCTSSIARGSRVVQLVGPFGYGSVSMWMVGRLSFFGGSWLRGRRISCSGLVQRLQGCT